jgi:ribosomal protein S12 methylthiotransferase accessory factor
LTRDIGTITVGARNLRAGGSLLTINDDRRIEFDQDVGQVRRELVDAQSSGFLGQLGRLINSASERANTAKAAVGRLLVETDPSVINQAVLNSLLHDAAESVGCPMVWLKDAGKLEPTDVLISIHSTFSYDRLTQLLDRVTDANARWCPFWREPGGARYGPVFDGVGPTIRDLAGRWISAAPSRKQASAILNAEESVASSLPVGGIEAAHEYAVFLRDVWTWLSGGTPQAWWRVVHIDRVGEVSHDVVLPLPSSEARSLMVDPRLSLMDVVNTRTGIVTRLRPITFRSPMPPDIRYVESQTADLSRLRSWASNIYNAGSSWGDDSSARAGAVGEAIERYCGNVTDIARLRFASFDELTRGGARAVDPRELVLFSDEQYANPRFPFIPFARDTRTHWVRGNSLVDGGEIFVPASLAFVNWNSGLSLYSPRTNPAYYPGIAAAATREAALANAVEEVVERDAAMVWWWSGHVLPTAPDQEEVLESIVPYSWREQAGMRISAIPLTNAIGIATTAVAVDAEREGLLTIGLASRRTAAEAVGKALLEALGLQESALDMQDSEGGFWQSQDASRDSGAVRPIRVDRRYLESYHPTFRDVTDLFCQLQVQLDPRAAHATRRRLGKQGGSGLAGLPSFAKRDAQEYVAALGSAGYEPVVVDLTTNDVAATGWHVVRVVVPGLVPNFPTAFPPLGRGRLQRAPQEHGWSDHALGLNELDSFPMPYA